MTERAPEPLCGPVAVLAPSGRDGPIIAETLSRAGLTAVLCPDVAAFCAQIPAVAAGIIAEEVVNPVAIARLAHTLSKQPPWSDLPIIVLALPVRSGGVRLYDRLAGVANITLIERPMQSFTLTAAVRAALRARARQLLTREHLQELLHARESIARHRDDLQEAVRRRTEELQATSQVLRLSERMASIGALAAGLGHDLANLLLPVHAGLDAVERSPERASEQLASIRKSLNYIGKLSASMRLLALDPDGGGADDPDTELAAWWEDVTPLLRLAVPKGVELEVAIPAGLVVRLAPHRLTQAVLNLVSNAGDAIMCSGGSGRIRVSAAVAPEPERVSIAVADDGPGMTEETKRRCLEPLFTTGSHDGSTGLGLSLVDGIARAAGGEITVESVLGDGAVFTLTLPGGMREPDRPRPVAAVTVADARLRSLLQTLLRRGGYALTGDITADPAPSLWFTDPTEAAASLAPELRRKAPGVRMVVFGDATPQWSALGALRLATDAPVSSLRELIRNGAVSRGGAGAA